MQRKITVLTIITILAVAALSMTAPGETTEEKIVNGKFTVTVEDLNNLMGEFSEEGISLNDYPEGTPPEIVLEVLKDHPDMAEKVEAYYD